MVVAKLADAPVAVALDDRTIPAERARLSRLARALAAQDQPAVVSAILHG
jgi:hypothetical protein